MSVLFPLLLFGSLGPWALGSSPTLLEAWVQFLGAHSLTGLLSSSVKVTRSCSTRFGATLVFGRLPAQGLQSLASEAFLGRLAGAFLEVEETDA